MVTRASFAVLFAGLLLSGCGSSSGAKPAKAPAGQAANNPKTGKAIPRRNVPEGHIRREDILAVLSHGPAAFLRRIDVEPALHRGKFVGWRVRALHEPRWQEEQVRPGDVVMAVNGHPVETDLQFFDVFIGMIKAKELRIKLRRQGRVRDVFYPISDDPKAPTPKMPKAGETIPVPANGLGYTQDAPRLQPMGPPPETGPYPDAPPRRNPRWKTTVIGGG